MSFFLWLDQVSIIETGYSEQWTKALTLLPLPYFLSTRVFFPLTGSADLSFHRVCYHRGVTREEKMNDSGDRL